MAGYSGTPLPKKLGIKEGALVCFVGAPANFAKTLGELPDGVTVKTSLSGRVLFDVIVLFALKVSTFQKSFPTAKGRLHSTGGLWIGWPKKASGVKTDMTENIVRSTALASGLVDNKVCAIDEVWSGLRCVVRVKDRPSSR